MSVKYFFVGLSFFTLFSSTIYIITNDMTLVQIKPPQRDDIVKTHMKGRNSLNTIDHDPNCTTSEFLKCHTNNETLKQNLVIDETIEEWSTIEKRNPAVLSGGLFAPNKSQQREKVAILIPYRDRKNHLKILLNHLHPLLQRQNLFYGIFVINQIGSSPFNRGMLFNIGFLEAMKTDGWSCFVFHDVDLLPQNDLNIYNCAKMPRHMSVAIDIMNYSLPYKKLFGGVSSMSTDTFKLINGYPNRYWGWGGEDDDVSKRIRIHGLSIVRYPITIARYKMLQHPKETPNRRKGKNLKNADRYDSFDGLKNTRYHPISIQKMPLYTNITVNLIQPG